MEIWVHCNFLILIYLERSHSPKAPCHNRTLILYTKSPEQSGLSLAYFNFLHSISFNGESVFIMIFSIFG